MATRATDILKSVEIFGRLPDEELAKLAKLLKERKLAENQMLFAQGDNGDALYIVIQGSVKIFTVDQFGREKVLAFVGEGQFFGDMALLTGAPRSASAQASRDTKLFQLRKDDFDVLVASNVELMKEMLRVVAVRQAATNQRLSQEASAEAGSSKGLLSVVFSPRGGSGKTTIAVNLAVSLAQAAPDRVALADFDLAHGHVPVLLNLAPRTSLASTSPSALAHLDREGLVHYLTTHDESSLRIMAGALHPDEAELVTGDHVRAMLQQLQRQFVNVVVDTASNFSDATLAALELADQVFLIVLPEPTSLRDTRECQRIFSTLLGLPREKFKLILNHTHPYRGIPREQVEEVLGSPLVAEIPYGADTPAEAALAGYPIVIKWPTTPVGKKLSVLGAEVNRTAREALALGPR